MTNETRMLLGAKNGIQQAVGIIWTAFDVLLEAGKAGKLLQVEVCGALGEMLGHARTRLAGTQEFSVYRDLDAVQTLLTKAREEDIPLSPTISLALTNILTGVMENIHKRGLRCFVCVGEDMHGGKPIDSAPATAAKLSTEAIKAELLDILKKCTQTLGIVDSLKKKDDATAARVPDWRDAQSAPNSGVLRDATGEDGKTSGSARTQEDTKPEDKPAAKPEGPTIKTIAITDKNGKKKVVSAIDGNAKCYTGTESKPAAKSAAKPAKENVKPDGTVEVSGFFSPEQKEKLIADIRAYLSEFHDGHRLSELIEDIKQSFELSDGMIGELIGVSARLITHVRHGRKSPYTLSRFTEVFGVDGGAGTRDEVSGSARTQKEA